MLKYMITNVVLECPVCYDENLKVCKVWCLLPCTHVLCMDCASAIMTGLKIQCPMCRTDIPLPAEWKRPSREVTPVALNIQTVLDEDGIDAIVRRVQATGRLSTAVVSGAAPRNRRPSFRIVNALAPAQTTPPSAEEEAEEAPRSASYD